MSMSCIRKFQFHKKRSKDQKTRPKNLGRVFIYQRYLPTKPSDEIAQRNRHRDPYLIFPLITDSLQLPFRS